MSKESEEPISFSPREMEVLAVAWQCFESEPKIDMKKLARLTGYTPGSASVTMGKIKRKLKMHASGLEDDDTTPAATPKKQTASTKGTPKSGGKRGAPVDGDGGPGIQTLSRKKKSPSKKSAARHESDDEEEFKNTRIKKEEAAELTKGAQEYFDKPGVLYDLPQFDGAGMFGGYDGYPTF